MPSFRVIRASAGSGKTFALAKEYLRLLFADSDYFMHILAVTFTNKATNEMKSRILRELHLLASDQPSYQLKELMAATRLSEKQIRLKSAVILKKLLHRYSSFSVTTIDSFFQRIIRAFTRELGIQGAYSIELDTDTLLTEVINRLLVKAETDRSLLTWLTRFAESLIERGESWNFRKSIRLLGSEIFREEFKSMGNDTLNRLADRSFLEQFQTELKEQLRRTREEYTAFGKKAMHIMANAGLGVDDFSGKSRGPAGFLSKIATGEFKDPTSTAVESALRIEKWYAKNSLHGTAIAGLKTELLPLMQETIDFYNHHHVSYFSLEAALSNMFTLGILYDLSQLAYAWCHENNAFLLPEAPVFLNKIIDSNDTPFIYEKAGTWYHHFMIDEFQDTSQLQWLNFKPLISNSLSQDYDNLVVGDVKQSIYRWRNSNWEILDRGLESDFPSGVIEMVSLENNWRSRTRIIQFNNLFFQQASFILQQAYNQVTGDTGNSDSTITRLYADIMQQPGRTNFEGGHVEVGFIESDEDTSFTDAANQAVIKKLCSLQDQGYALSDIALITRKNKEAKQLAEFLIAYGNDHPGSGYRFDVISDEALRLGSSAVVVFLSSLLTWMINPGDKITLYYLLGFYRNLIAGNTQEPEWFNPESAEDARNEEFRRIFPMEFFELAGSPNSYSLVETLERLISIFNLGRFTGEKVYLQAFRDLVGEYAQMYSADPVRFLEYWNETGRERSISAPSGQDALRILTVHKSKGLEFNIVILPYCNWELNSGNNIHKGILWCKPEFPPLDKLEVIPVSYSSNLKKTIFASRYYTEYLRQYIDNLNLLYVAFTRPCEGLYIYCRTGKENQMKNVSDLVYNVFMEPAGTREALTFMDRIHSDEIPGMILSFGSLSKPDETRSMQTGQFFPSPQAGIYGVRDRIKIAFQGKIMLDPSENHPIRPVNEGRVLHEIFTAIHAPEDIVPAVTGMYLKGKINQEEKSRYINLITNLMNDIRVLSWFSGDWEVLTEAEIILPRKGTRRPDRVMVKQGQTLVVDYKFGKMLPEHREQVREYGRLLTEMGYPSVEAWLWYVRLGKVVREL